MLTLAQAAAMTGMNRSSILRAIKRGAITGTKDHNEVWHVDGAELSRAFPVTPSNTQPAHRTPIPTPWPLTSSRSPRNASPSLRNASRRCGSERDRAQAGEDAWKSQCEAVTRQIALPAPRAHKPRSSPHSRTGCR